jgi:hypothetical protein
MVLEGNARARRARSGCRFKWRKDQLERAENTQNPNPCGAKSTVACDVKKIKKMQIIQFITKSKMETFARAPDENVGRTGLSGSTSGKEGASPFLHLAQTWPASARLIWKVAEYSAP